MDIVERFAETLGKEETESLQHVRDYLAWQSERGSSVPSSEYDDVTLRTYLLSLKTSGVSLIDQRKRIASLRRFYTWAVAEGLLKENPFDAFSVERPRLSREQIRRRKEMITGTAEERQIARLRALNQLTEQLNRSSDVQTMLSVALETLVSLMDLQTAWAFLLPTDADGTNPIANFSTRDFALATAYGLPPGLEQEDRYYLSNRDGCHCQGMLAAGQMLRAVNIVECTRLQKSAKAEGDNQGLLFHASVPIIASGKSLGLINVATQEWQFLTSADLQLLSAIGTQVAIALERARLYDLTNAQRLRLERELELAREVQESLLPEKLPEIPGFSLAADWRSAREMAGDFYDIFALPDGCWGILVADVSDKGAAAAMYMAMTRSLLRASAASHMSPADVLQEVNRHLIAHSSSDMFVTVFYAVLDADAHTFRYANAGQNPPLIRRSAGQLEELRPTGPALGIFDEPTLTEATVALAAGDMLVAYTDGVTDAPNPQGEHYEMARLVQAILSAPGSNAGRALDHLLRDLSAFTRETPPFDDITLFILASERHSETND